MKSEKAQKGITDARSFHVHKMFIIWVTNNTRLDIYIKLKVLVLGLLKI